MKRFDDISPRHKEIPVQHHEEVSVDNDPNEQFGPRQILKVHKKQKKNNISSARIFSIVLFIIAVSVVCLVSIVEVKNKLLADFSGLNNTFEKFSDSLSNKDIPQLTNQISEINQKTSRAVVLLQGVGQDVYCLDLLYPKGTASKSTMSIDAIRSAHFLTQSFQSLANQESNSSQKATGGSDYISKINEFLVDANSFLSDLPFKLIEVRISSGAARKITNGLNVEEFSKNDKKTLLTLQKLSNTSDDFFQYMMALVPNLNDSLAFSGGEKSYLILFLNNAELRPGGGFIGSFARLDLKDGKATALDFEKNIYTLDKKWIEDGNKVAAPPEFLGANMSMRDSNYFADYVDSSKNVIDFYQKESGKKVDGVFSIDTTLFRNLLKVTGPISMPEYNLVVTDKNLLTDVQYQIEIAYFQNDENKKTNQPKKILSDLMPKVIAQLTKDSNAKEKTGKEIMKAISEKHLLMYFKNENVEDLIDGIGAGGKIHATTDDYLYLSDSNICGMKSSIYISETVNQNIEINNDGKVNENVSIIRKHIGTGKWPDGTNSNFIKMYLPMSTKVNSLKLISGSNVGPGGNLEPVIENGKNKISFWQITDIGKESRTDVNYSRQISIEKTAESFEYSIMVQKQPGIESFKWNLYLVYPEGWTPQNVEGYDKNDRKIFLSETIFKDSVFRLRFIRD